MPYTYINHSGIFDFAFEYVPQKKEPGFIAYILHPTFHYIFRLIIKGVEVIKTLHRRIIPRVMRN